MVNEYKASRLLRTLTLHFAMRLLTHLLQAQQWFERQTATTRMLQEVPYTNFVCMMPALYDAGFPESACL